VAEALVWVAHIDEVVVGYIVAERADDIVRIVDVWVTPPGQAKRHLHRRIVLLAR